MCRKWMLLLDLYVVIVLVNGKQMANVSCKNITFHVMTVSRNSCFLMFVLAQKLAILFMSMSGFPPLKFYGCR